MKKLKQSNQDMLNNINELVVHLYLSQILIRIYCNGLHSLQLYICNYVEHNLEEEILYLIQFYIKYNKYLNAFYTICGIIR